MKTVLITRPVELGKVLAEKIKTLNYNPIIFPAIETKPLSFDTQINFNQFNMIIFISPAAVINFSTHVKTLPPHLKIFTIGEDSAALIKELGWASPIYPLLFFSREALLNLPELQNVSQIPILVVEGSPSNNALSIALKLRGAIVTQLFVYERVLPRPTALPNLESIDIVIATNEQTLNNIVLLLGRGVKDKSLLVSSQRLADIAENMGFSQKPLLAKNAGDTALLQALKTVA